MSYNVDMNDEVRERIVKYLNTVNERKRPFEIAEAINSTPNYTRRVCNLLYDDDEVEKSWGKPIIGHPMPGGDTRVLVNNRDTLLNIVRQYAPNRISEAMGKSTISDLRDFIEEQIAIGAGHPLGNRKVYYSIGVLSKASASAAAVGAD